MKTRTSLVLLDEMADSQEALVRTSDGDLFIVATADAVRACRAFENARQFGTQFGELIEFLRTWVRQKTESIHSACVTIRERDILFLVTQKGVEFNSELSDALTDLDIQIANHEGFNLIDLEVLLIPQVSREACKAFITNDSMTTDA